MRFHKISLNIIYRFPTTGNNLLLSLIKKHYLIEFIEIYLCCCYVRQCCDRDLSTACASFLAYTIYLPTLLFLLSLLRQHGKSILCIIGTKCNCNCLLDFEFKLLFNCNCLNVFVHYIVCPLCIVQYLTFFSVSFKSLLFSTSVNRKDDLFNNYFLLTYCLTVANVNV